MLKTSGSIESTTRPGKSGVRVGGDGGETLTSRLKTSSLTYLSTNAAKVIIKYDELDKSGGGAGGKSVEKLSKSWKIVKKSEKPQRLEKVM